MDTYSTRLRYLDADDIDDSVVDVDGLDVLGSNDEKLGDIDGFIVDAFNARLLYAVVDSGGWFRSRRFLLPIGHLGPIDSAAGSVRTDLTKEALTDYPEFEADQFKRFTDDQLRLFETSAAAACCPDDTLQQEGQWGYEQRAHYRQPSWWNAEAYKGQEAAYVDMAPATSTERARESFDRERVAARDRDRDAPSAAEVADASPHYGGRAQPGDILGIETGGETTSIGDSEEDENARRRGAMKNAPAEDPARRRD